MNKQGNNSKIMFHGKGKAAPAYEFYAKSASLFADIIRRNLSCGKYRLLDFGGHRGELLGDILSLLPEYNLDSTIIDKVEGIDSNVRANKIVGDIINNPVSDKDADIVIMRYVFPWDKYENQKLILKEVKRVCRGIAIIQHQGAPDSNPKPLQDASLKLWSGVIPVLKRDNGFFTEASQIEKWMKDLEINFDKIEEKYIENVSDLFSEKFDLNDAETKLAKEILNGCDGITVTTWLIKF